MKSPQDQDPDARRATILGINVLVALAVYIYIVITYDKHHYMPHNLTGATFPVFFYLICHLLLMAAISFVCYAKGWEDAGKDWILAFFAVLVIGVSVCSVDFATS